VVRRGGVGREKGAGSVAGEAQHHGDAPPDAAGPGAALDVDALDTAEEESKIVGLC